jgi:hypothetical protein
MSKAASSTRVPLYILVLGLMAAGLFLSFYRHYVFDVPWLPDGRRQIWSIEAKVEFEALSEPVKLSLAVPDSQPGFERVSEHTASPGYGLAFVGEGVNRRAEWSIREASGRQTLYYQVDMLFDEQTVDMRTAAPPTIETITYAGPEATAVTQFLQRARARSADAFTMTRELIAEFNSESQLAQLLVQQMPRERRLVQMLNLAGIPARVVQTLYLEDGRRRQSLVSYLQVFSGAEYALFNPQTGSQGQEANQLLWEQNSGSLLDLVGGRDSGVSFSIISQEVPASRVYQEKVALLKNAMDFSIHSLPLEEQTMFKGILLIPVGVLVVVIMRILVGLRTSGTFMPVLIALAFIQTSLITGLVGFFLIVGIGLIIRAYLSRHNLLLVARISAVIISVIIIIAVFSIVAYGLGLAEGLKITFFPMIILAWTIERMSILWEEEGAKEVLAQGGGSLLVAVLAYLVMINPVVRHLMFNFIGLQLVFMALVLLCGNYTGYRLSELRRFKHLVQSK